MVPGVLETAAVSISPPDGGPDELIVYAVLQRNPSTDPKELKSLMQHEIRLNLNPLFKIHDLIIIASLPRTASNKVMRRRLRANYVR